MVYTAQMVTISIKSLGWSHLLGKFETKNSPFCVYLPQNINCTVNLLNKQHTLAHMVYQKQPFHPLACIQLYRAFYDLVKFDNRWLICAINICQRNFNGDAYMMLKPLTIFQILSKTLRNIAQFASNWI